jgi:hypothetical protein
MSMITTSTQILVSKYHSALGGLGKMATSRFPGLGQAVYKVNWENQLSHKAEVIKDK